MAFTAGSLLREAGRKLADAGFESASLDAQILLAHVLKRSREFLLIHSDVVLQQQEQAEFELFVNRRLAGEAIAYIVGEKEFFNYKFKITPSVLVPRPETELLVEHTLVFLQKVLQNISDEQQKTIRYHDTCTGSGCVGISVKAMLPLIDVSVSDISKDALAVCKTNMVAIVGYEIPYFESNLLDAVPGTFMCITANPPYVSTDYTNMLMEKKLKEPRIALDGGVDGLDIYRKLIPDAYKKLQEGGALLVEIGEEQALSVCEMYSKTGFTDITVYKDLAGHDRIVFGVKNEVLS
ncbi:MAG TPA: peptide chain release factor N(5)-glutamine methyltransferase [Spirochaetales bacterium]|nr:peptide chain release factor N(5)-glutamine methyltransferase [Spirochaetales bacterium]